jgi:hypothetical protein
MTRGNPGPRRRQAPRVGAPVRGEAHAVRICEAVCAAWHRHDVSGRLDVPVSVVAALA